MAIPLLIAGAVVAAGAAAAAAATKTGKSNYRAPGFGTDPKYNPDAFHLGGTKGFAPQRAHDYRLEAGAAQDRRAPGTDYSAADRYRQLSDYSRDAQRDAAGLMMQRARGEVPSISRMAGDRAMQQAVAEQQSAMASARGAGALALAQQNAAANTASAQQNIGAQTQIAEAQERLAAEQAAFGAYSGIRGADVQTMAEQARMAQFLTQSELQQRGMNDQYSLGLYGYENAVRMAELQAQMQEQQMLANSLASSNQINAGVSMANAAQDWKYVGMGIGGMQGAMSAGMMAGGGGGGGGAVGSTKSSLTGDPNTGMPPPNPMMAQQVQGGLTADPSPVRTNTQALGGPAVPMYGGLAGLQPRVVAQRPMQMGMQPRVLAPVQAPPQIQRAPQQAPMGLAAPAQPRPNPPQAMFDPRKQGLMRAA